MKKHRTIQSTLGLLACAGALLNASNAQAAMIGYHVDVNTQSLVGNANGPFYLDFQFNHGAGPNSNDALINHVLFGAGGSLTGSPNLSGSAAGDLNSAVTMTANNANAFNEAYQAFSPSGFVSFDFFVSSKQTTTTPDALIFAILDGTTGQIPTTDPLHLSFVELDIASDGSVIMQKYTGANDPTYGNYEAVTVNVTPVPEASTTLAGLAALGCLGVALHRGRNAMAQPAH